LTEGILSYEILFEYDWSLVNVSNVSVNIIGNQYKNSYCYLSNKI